MKLSGQDRPVLVDINGTEHLDSLNYGIDLCGQDDQLIHTNPYASSFLSGVHKQQIDAIDELFN